MHDEERPGDRMPTSHPLMAALGLVARRMMGRVERETGLGASEWYTLVALGWRDGLSQAELARQSEIDPARVTQMAQPLERAGLIRRGRDPADRRLARLFLTDEGREVLRRGADLNRRLDGRIRSVVSEGEADELRRLLLLLAAVMED